MLSDFIINKKKYSFNISGSETLLTLLRNNGFTEIKNGCSNGTCGSCMILLDGLPVNACQVLAGSAVLKKITTVQGIGTIHEPHPIQKAFVETGAVQCGFCTPAKVLCAYSLLSKNLNPSDEDIKNAFDGNLCRCTGYVKIIEAVRLAAKRMKENE
jgi:aerobic-type carbon monoxide dehydrogenase small subunit (CoxS/CutS family)